MSHNEETHKAMLFTVGALRWMVDHGFASNTSLIVTPKGTAEFDQLEASGYRPNEETVYRCLAGLVQKDYISLSSLDAMLLTGCIANWDAFKECAYGREEKGQENPD